MKEAAIWVLCIYASLNALIIWYFFVYKQGKADDEYMERMRKIYDKF